MSKQQLPPKEAGSFKQLVKLYETKQYKKALKIADQILKKFPDHGETLSMKGLTLSNLDGHKEEAYDLVRRGLKNDLKSHVCWHVYGLMYRADRDYREAIKCYMNALRLDKDNLQILRDLALLQVQTRDLQGFVETRQQILALKPNNRNHWITFAVAHHVNKAYDVAIQVLEQYERTLDEVPPSEAYEHSELLLYRALILEEAGRVEDALALLDESKDKIRDKMGMMETRAALLLRAAGLGHGRRSPAEAEAAYRLLVSLNPEHYRYHSGLQAALGLQAAAGQPLSETQRSGLTELYGELQKAYPSSSACKRIPLDFLVGEQFVTAADSYVRKFLLKGVPSLFRDMRPLYSDEAKVAALQQLFESYSASLANSQCFPPAAVPTPAEPSSSNVTAASPQARVWVLYYLAQHYSRLGQHQRALFLVDEALTHTPTLIELQTVRAKILRRSGDAESAAHCAETARRFDLSDRYLNTMAVKALLRANKVDAAEKTAALFTKDGDQVSNLYDMQHMLYETAAGSAHLRLKEYGQALKKFLAVCKHFDDIHEDQFDFHSYCIRKATLRAYVAMLRMEDTVYASDCYEKAASAAVRCYLDLHDRPESSTKGDSEEELLAGMTAEERKKYKLKKKKEEKAKQKEAEAKAEADAAKAADKGKKGSAAAGGAAAKADPDPDGSKLAATTDPLGEATKLVVMMKQHLSKKLSTHLMAFEVYIRKGRFLLALSAVQQALAIGGASCPDAHVILVRLCQAVSGASVEQPLVSQVLQQGVQGLLGGKQLAQYVQDWASQYGVLSLPHRMAAARVLVALGAPAEDKAEAAMRILETPIGSERVRHDSCVEADGLLAGPLGHAPVSEQWKQKCGAEFPVSTYFDGVKQLKLAEETGFDFDHMTEAFGKLTFA